MDPAWPANGIVEIDNYSTRYRPGLDLVLTSIDVSVQSGEKVDKSDVNDLFLL